MNSLLNIAIKLSAVILITFFVGCSQSNTIRDSWTNPDATKESIKFKKVAVFGLVMKTATRRTLEDALASKLINTIAVPSYKIINDDDLGNVDVIKAKLAEQVFDGALILRLKDIESRDSYSPGMYPTSYYSFGGYYNYSWGYMYGTGGTYRTDQILTAEVNIYSLKEDKLMWSGETMSVNPQNIDKIVTQLSESVKRQLVRDGLLEEQPE